MATVPHRCGMIARWSPAWPLAVALAFTVATQYAAWRLGFHPRLGSPLFILSPASRRTSATQIIATACHFVFFFTSRTSGERWVAKHPGTFLYSVEDAFALARRANAKYFGAELARRPTAA